MSDATESELTRLLQAVCDSFGGGGTVSSGPPAIIALGHLRHWVEMSLAAAEKRAEAAESNYKITSDAYEELRDWIESLPDDDLRKKLVAAENWKDCTLSGLLAAGLAADANPSQAFDFIIAKRDALAAAEAGERSSNALLDGSIEDGQRLVEKLAAAEKRAEAAEAKLNLPMFEDGSGGPGPTPNEVHALACEAIGATPKQCDDWRFQSVLTVGQRHKARADAAEKRVAELEAERAEAVERLRSMSL